MRAEGIGSENNITKGELGAFSFPRFSVLGIPCRSDLLIATFRVNRSKTLELNSPDGESC